MFEAWRLKRIANVLRYHSEMGTSPTVMYDMMSDGVIWSDELPDKLLLVRDWSRIRYVIRARTCLIVGSDIEYAKWWQAATQTFPSWIGFHESRCRPDLQLQVIYQSSKDASLRELIS